MFYLEKLFWFLKNLFHLDDCFPDLFLIVHPQNMSSVRVVVIGVTFSSMKRGIQGTRPGARSRVFFDLKGAHIKLPILSRLQNLFNHVESNNYVKSLITNIFLKRVSILEENISPDSPRFCIIAPQCHFAYDQDRCKTSSDLCDIMYSCGGLLVRPVMIEDFVHLEVRLPL